MRLPIPYPPFFTHHLVKRIKNGWREVISFMMQGLFSLLKLFFRLLHGRVPETECVFSTAPKFAFVSHVLPPSWSGQAVVIGRILRDLEPGNYCLISKQNSRQQEGQIQLLTGRYHCLGNEKMIPINRSLLRDINIILSILQRGWKMARILVAEKCRSAVVGTGDLVDLPATQLACFLSGTTFYAYYFDDYVYQWTGMMRQFARLFEWIIFRCIGGLIVPNEYLWKEMKSRRNINATIIHNPCEVIPDEQDEKLEESRGCEIRIVYTGAVYHVNFGAIRNLIAALDALKRPEIKLHLYTAQPVDWLAKNGISGAHVVQHDHVSHPEVVKAQSSAHILFIPFDFHSPVPEVIRTSAPGKLGDYLACGTPILAHVPPDTFVKWYLTEHRCGVVVDQDDPEAVGQAVLRLLEDRDLRQSIHRHAQERARIDFDPRAAQGQFLKTLGYGQAVAKPLVLEENDILFV
jgi:glycosyltransferase involved in cell wall biosynthesis